MEKSEKRERAGEEGDYTPIILFTAGTTFLAAAFVKRTVMLLLMERWRVWVFMAINLVLLAIFFTSNPSTLTGKKAFDSHSRDEPKKREESSTAFPLKGEADDSQTYEVEVDGEEEKSMEEKPEAPRLSKEELNERVEAFILMFKQHLVSDAKNAERKGSHCRWNAQNEALSFKARKSNSSLRPFCGQM